MTDEDTTDHSVLTTCSGFTKLTGTQIDYRDTTDVITETAEMTLKVIEGQSQRHYSAGHYVTVSDVLSLI